MYRVRVRLRNVLSLVEPGRLDDVGLTRERLESDDLSACQLVGGAVRWLEHDGLLVPSVRASGTNLVIFPGEAFTFEVVGSEVIAATQRT